jgi:hypothetical protein
VKADGTVIGWGAPDWYLTQFSELQNIKQITNNSDGFIALKSDGTVVSRSPYQPPLGLNSVTFVDGSQYGGYALKADGTVVGWGDELFEPVLIPDNLRGVNALDFGYGLVLALKKAPRQP